MDEKIRQSLTRYGRSVDALQKITDGTYMSAKKKIIVMIKDDGKDSLVAEFMRADGSVFKTSLNRFISEYE